MLLNHVPPSRGDTALYCAFILEDLEVRTNELLFEFVCILFALGCSLNELIGWRRLRHGAGFYLHCKSIKTDPICYQCFISCLVSSTSLFAVKELLVSARPVLFSSTHQCKSHSSNQHHYHHECHSKINARVAGSTICWRGLARHFNGVVVVVVVVVASRPIVTWKQPWVRHASRICLRQDDNDEDNASLCLLLLQVGALGVGSRKIDARMRATYLQVQGIMVVVSSGHKEFIFDCTVLGNGAVPLEMPTATETGGTISIQANDTPTFQGWCNLSICIQRQKTYCVAVGFHCQQYYVFEYHLW